MQQLISLPEARYKARSAYVRRECAGVWLALLALLLLSLAALTLLPVPLVIVAALVVFVGWTWWYEVRSGAAAGRFVASWDRHASVRIDHEQQGTTTLIVHVPALPYSYRKKI